MNYYYDSLHVIHCTEILLQYPALNNHYHTLHIIQSTHYLYNAPIDTGMICKQMCTFFLLVWTVYSRAQFLSLCCLKSRWQRIMFCMTLFVFLSVLQSVRVFGVKKSKVKRQYCHKTPLKRRNCLITCFWLSIRMIQFMQYSQKTKFLELPSFGISRQRCDNGGGKDAHSGHDCISVAESQYMFPHLF